MAGPGPAPVSTRGFLASILSWFVGTLTANKIPKGSASAGLADSSISDDGTNVTTTENVLIDSDTAQLKIGDAQTVGVAYFSAGVAKVTDGSTGYGELKFANNVTTKYLAAMAALQ